MGNLGPWLISLAVSISRKKYYLSVWELCFGDRGPMITRLFAVVNVDMLAACRWLLSHHSLLSQDPWLADGCSSSVPTALIGSFRKLAPDWVIRMVTCKEQWDWSFFCVMTGQPIGLCFTPLMTPDLYLWKVHKAQHPYACWNTADMERRGVILWDFVIYWKHKITCMPINKHCFTGNQEGICLRKVTDPAT